MMTYENNTTTERLQLEVSRSYGVVVKYGESVLVADLHWKGFFEAAVYRFTGECTDIEAPVELTRISPCYFEDSGHALEWCMNCVKEAEEK